jgi:hypothetical protein
MADTHETRSFGPPISHLMVEPPERPLALGMVIDVSNSVYGDRRVIDIIKEELTYKLSNMESDELLYLDGRWYDSPGGAVAGLQSHAVSVRDLTSTVAKAVNSLAMVDRAFRRRLLLITDQFMHRETLLLKKMVNQNQMRFLDIVFSAIGYGPQYVRTLSECGWDYRHVEDLADFLKAYDEVIK